MTTTQRLRDRVFDTIPGYRDAETIIAHSNAASPIAIPDAKEARAAIVGRVRAAILANEPIPDTIADELAAIDRAREAHEAVNNMINQVAQDARQTIGYALPIDSDPAYHLLDRELQDLMSGVQALLPALDSATTANEAVSAGSAAVDAWGTLQGLADRYDEIRAVQQEIVPRDESGRFWDRLLTVGLYRDALAVHPYFPEIGQKAPFHSGRVAVSWGKPHGRPQLSGEQSWWPEDLDRPAALLRIVTHATPWVPTPSTLEGVWSRAVAASARIGETDDPRVAAEREHRLAEHDKYLASL